MCTPYILFVSSDNILFLLLSSSKIKKFRILQFLFYKGNANTNTVEVEDVDSQIIDEAFDDIDTNGDGVITYKEFMSYTNANNVSRGDANEMFDLADMNGNEDVKRKLFLIYFVTNIIESF